MWMPDRQGFVLGGAAWPPVPGCQGKITLTFCNLPPENRHAAFALERRALERNMRALTWHG
jgi:hypothetical protein